MPDSTPAPETTGRKWVIPDDGIIDPIAVEIAASGKRPVRLTLPERRAAAAASWRRAAPYGRSPGTCA